MKNVLEKHAYTWDKTAAHMGISPLVGFATPHTGGRSGEFPNTGFADVKSCAVLSMLGKNVRLDVSGADDKFVTKRAVMLKLFAHNWRGHQPVPRLIPKNMYDFWRFNERKIVRNRWPGMKKLVSMFITMFANPLTLSISNM